MLTAVPMHDRILIKPDAAQETVGDLYIAQTAQAKPLQGTIVAVGPGRYAQETGVLVPMQSKVGDKVKYSKFVGTEIELEDGTYVVMREIEALIIL